MNYVVYTLDKGFEMYYNEFGGWMLDIHSATLYPSWREAKKAATTLKARYKKYANS